MKIISLEGNLGSGKEQFIEFFKKYFTDDLLFLDDSLYTWENENFLKKFYKDPNRWSFTLEVYSTIQKYQKLLKVDETFSKVVITRRSPVSNRECFVKTCKEIGYIDEKEYSIYNEMFNTLNIHKMQGVIYLKSNVNKCYESILSKSQNKNINFNFIQKLHNNYELWIECLKKEKIPVLTINIDNFRDIEGNEQTQEKLLTLITEKFPCIKECIKKYRYTNWTTVTRKKKKNAF